MLQTYRHLDIKEKLSVNWQYFETCGVISYGSGWRKDIVNQRLECVLDNDADIEERIEV